MEAPNNSSEEEEEIFDFEAISCTSPRLQHKGKIECKEEAKLPSVTDSIPTIAKMKEINSKTNLARITRAPVWKWDGELITRPLLDHKLKILVCNWNLLGKLPSAEEAQILLNTKRIKHDIYVIGSEECERSIAASVFVNSKEAWEANLLAALGSGYNKLCSHTLMATHIIVFISSELLPLVGEIETDTVACGLGNTLGNKGGVSISFCIGKTSFVFVCCHLAAGQGEVERRNEDYDRIVKTLENRKKFSEEPNSLDRADAAVFFGDLNYRVNSSVSMIDYLLKQEMFDVVVQNDQLGIEKKKGKVAHELQEGRIEFAPTYRFFEGTDDYNISSTRIPSYTDRILFKTKSPTTLRIISYDSNNLLKLSDHRPVFAQFLCNFSYTSETPDEETPEEIALKIALKEHLFGQARSATCSIFLHINLINILTIIIILYS